MRIHLNDVLASLPKIDVNSLKAGQRLPVEVVSTTGAGKSALIKLGGQEIEAKMETMIRPGERFWATVREVSDQGLILSRSQNTLSELNISPQQIVTLLSRGLPLDVEIAALVDKFSCYPQQMLSALRNVLVTIQNPVLKEALTQLLRAVPQWESVSTQGLVNFLKGLGVQHENQLYDRMAVQNNVRGDTQGSSQTQPQGLAQVTQLVSSQAPSSAQSQSVQGQGQMQEQGASPSNPQGLNSPTGQAQGGQALQHGQASLNQGSVLGQAPASGLGSGQGQTAGSVPNLGQSLVLGQVPSTQNQVSTQTGQTNPMNPTYPQQGGPAGIPLGALPGASAGAAPEAQLGSLASTSSGPSAGVPTGSLPEASGEIKAAAMGSEANQQATRPMLSAQAQRSEAGGDLAGLQIARATQDSDTLKSKLIRLLEATGQNLETRERGIAKALLDDITAQQLWLQSGIRKNAFVLMNMLLQDQEGLYQARIAIESARKGSKMDPQHCRIAVQVDTYHLGTVGADVWLYEDRIHLCLLSDDPEGLTEGIQAELPFAQEHFQALGMVLASITTKNFEDMPRFKTFLAGEQLEVDVEG